MNAEKPVQLTVGVGATIAALAGFPLGERPLVIRDSAVEPIRSVSASGAIDFGFDATGGDRDVVSEILAAGQEATSVVALGGGSTLDIAKVARMLLVAPDPSALLDSLEQPSGFLHLPEVAGPHGSPLPLMATPTTLGTGAEVSREAFHPTTWGRRLLVGSRLRADHAVLDPRHTSTLPWVLQMEGVVEVILRVIGRVIGSSPSLAADHDARAIVGNVIGLAESLRTRLLDDEERLVAARASAASHRSGAPVGRASDPRTHWCLANELSWTTRTREIPAMIMVLPAVWERIARGDERWGSKSRLALAWSWVRDAIPELPRDAGEGLPVLFDRWNLQPIHAPDVAALHEAAARVHEFRGESVPARGRIGLDEFREILEECASRFGGVPAHSGHVSDIHG